MTTPTNLQPLNEQPPYSAPNIVAMLINRIIKIVQTIGTLSGLGDVSITVPQNKQTIEYDAATKKWKNSEVSALSTSTDTADTTGSVTIPTYAKTFLEASVGGTTYLVPAFAPYSNEDPYWDDVSALLHFNGSNGSKTFTDEKGNTWTATAGAEISTSESKFGGASLALDGSGDYISTPDATKFSPGSSDFTMECWIYPTSIPSGDATIATKRPNTGSEEFDFFLAAGKPQLAGWLDNGTVVNMVSTSVVSSDTWTNVSWTRSGGDWYLFINGTVAATATYSGALGQDTNQGLYVGHDPSNSARDFPGYIDELRITKGVARYTGDYTVQSREFPNQ